MLRKPLPEFVTACRPTKQGAKIQTLLCPSGQGCNLKVSAKWHNSLCKSRIKTLNASEIRKESKNVQSASCGIYRQKIFGLKVFINIYYVPNAIILFYTNSKALEL
jgi:hypothetical protein